jgi:hypothetical protein
LEEEYYYDFDTIFTLAFAVEFYYSMSFLNDKDMDQPLIHILVASYCWLDENFEAVKEGTGV